MRAAAIPAAGRYYSPDRQNALPPNVKSIPTRPLSPRPFHPPLTPPTPPAKGPSTTIGQRPADSAHPTRTGYHHQHPHPTLRLHPPSAPNGSTGPRLPHPRPQTGRGNRQNQTKQDDKQTPKSTPGVPATHTNSQQTATLPPNPQNTAPCQPNPHTPSPNRFSRKPPPTTPARQKAPSAAIGQKPADSAHPTRTGYHHQHPHPAPPLRPPPTPRATAPPTSAAPAHAPYKTAKSVFASYPMRPKRALRNRPRRNRRQPQRRPKPADHRLPNTHAAFELHLPVNPIPHPPPPATTGRRALTRRRRPSAGKQRASGPDRFSPPTPTLRPPPPPAPAPRATAPPPSAAPALPNRTRRPPNPNRAGR